MSREKACPGLDPGGSRLAKKDRRQLMFRQAIGDKVGNVAGGERIEVRQNRNDVTRPRTDSQISVHTRRASAMAEAADAPDRLVLESERIASAWGVDLGQ